MNYEFGLRFQDLGCMGLFDSNFGQDKKCQKLAHHAAVLVLSLLSYYLLKNAKRINNNNPYTTLKKEEHFHFFRVLKQLVVSASRSNAEYGRLHRCPRFFVATKTLSRV